MPSVSDQPAGHFERSTVQPSGPVSVLPSADLPHLLVLIRWMIAARSFAQSVSQSASEVGSAAATVVEVAAVVVVAPDVDVAPPAVVAVAPFLLSSPPQAAATRARLTRPAATATLR